MVFVLLGIGLLVLVVLAPIAFFLVLQSHRDIAKIEARQREFERRLALVEKAGGTIPTASAEAPASPLIPASPGAVPLEAAAPKAPTPRKPLVSSGDVERWVGGQWLTWLGILAIFFGTAFFLAYDLGESPLAGMGQLLTGLAVGAFFIVAGRILTGRRERFLGRGLLGGGVALLYLAAYAAYGFHHLVPALVVFPFLFGASLVGGALALLEDSLMVASLTQIGAFLTPLLLTGGGDPTGFLFVYLVAVNMGTAWVAARRRWPYLPLAAFLGTALLVVQWWVEFYAPESRGTALWGVGALWALYLAIPLAGALQPGFWGTARSAVAVANGLLAVLFLYRVLAPDFVALRGLAAAGLALIYAVVGSLAARRLGPIPTARALRVTAIAIAALAVPIQFDWAWITLGWSLMAVALLWTGTESDQRGDRLLAYGIALMAVVRVLSFDTVDSLQRFDRVRPFLNGNFLVGLAAAALLGLGALILRRRRSRLPREEVWLIDAFVIVAASLLLWRLSVESVAFFAARERFSGDSTRLESLLTLSLIWAAYAGLLIAAGFALRYRPIRLLGVGLLGILIMKVFFFDAQALERGYRVASFVGVGLLLLSISILYQRERRA